MGGTAEAPQALSRGADGLRGAAGLPFRAETEGIAEVVPKFALRAMADGALHTAKEQVGPITFPAEHATGTPRAMVACTLIVPHAATTSTLAEGPLEHFEAERG